MFGWITRFSLQFRILVLALAAGLISFGVVNVPKIAVDSMPEFAPRTSRSRPKPWVSPLSKSSS